MAIRKLKPTTPGQRHKIIGTFDNITTNVPEKSLVVGKSASGGRNSQGKMTVQYLGGGHKRRYRIIDFKRSKDGIPAIVKTIEYDPNRSARIALLFYADGAKTYILAPNGLTVGTTVMSGADAAPEVGNSLPLSKIPIDNVKRQFPQSRFLDRRVETFNQNQRAFHSLAGLTNGLMNSSASSNRLHQTLHSFTVAPSAIF